MVTKSGILTKLWVLSLVVAGALAKKNKQPFQRYQQAQAENNKVGLGANVGDDDGGHHEDPRRKHIHRGRYVWVTYVINESNIYIRVIVDQSSKIDEMKSGS